MTWATGLPFWYTLSGDRTILLDRRFNSDEGLDIRFVRDIIVQENCQIAKLSAASCLELTELIQRESFGHVTSPLNTVLLAGQPLKENILTVVGPLTKTVYNMYGSSEIGGSAEVLVIKVPDEALLNEICACFIPEKGSDVKYLNCPN
ncbi:uncharacterized protein LOC126830398 [Patella vulgata]|uniref:uncharacterized protein LOC126830398 n=1 Tax=Patella vulgata TaxID=6465 RepID=UPI0024A9030F|nr:uncharacterized protein LOC126830398 [Patella vulgata]